MTYKHSRLVFEHAPAVLTPTERLLLLTLAVYMADDDTAYPSTSQLASDMGVSKRTVIRSSARLVELDCIRIEKNAGGSSKTPVNYRPNLYRWTLNAWTSHKAKAEGEGRAPEFVEVSDDTVDEFSTGVDNDSIRGDTADTARGDISGNSRGDILSGVTFQPVRGDNDVTYKTNLKPITPLTPQSVKPASSRRARSPDRKLKQMQAQEELARLASERTARQLRAWKDKNRIIGDSFLELLPSQWEFGADYRAERMFEQAVRDLILTTGGSVSREDAAARAYSVTKAKMKPPKIA